MQKENDQISKTGTPQNGEEDQTEAYEFEHAWFYIAGTDIPEPKDEDRIAQK